MANVIENEIRKVKIPKDDVELLEKLRCKELKKHISKKIKELENSFKDLCAEFDKRFDNNEWIYMTDEVYYINSVSSFINDLEKKQCYYQNSSKEAVIDKSDWKFNDLQGNFPTEKEAKEIFGPNCKHFKQANGKIKCCGRDYDGVTVTSQSWFYLTVYSELAKDVFKYGTQEVKSKDILTVPIYRLNGIDSERMSTSDVILSWLKYGLRPSEFTSPEIKKIYDNLKNIYNKEEYSGYLKSGLEGNIIFDDQESCVEKMYNDCLSGKKLYFLDNKAVSYILNEQKEFEADEEFLAEFTKKFLESDFNRAGLDTYKENRLEDHNLGHWDLFDYNDSIDSEIIVEFKNPIYSRNPKEDVDIDKYVAIDFGTKSTVVSYKDNESQRIVPINVGKSEDFSDMSNFENPTVMYFIDFGTFKDKYYDKIKYGRPDTSWEDLNISYSASDALKHATKENYSSFLTDLKSWCSSKNKISVKNRDNGDRKGQLYVFKPYGDIVEGDDDPVEYYAYYLGLYINRMAFKNIYMKYKMSFPATYEQQLRDKILDSFRRGIKKSFPKSLLANEELMNEFEVEFDRSEPAAYAATALEKFNFKPNEGDEYYYSVFDFGGGTTDFDFGVYRGLSDDEIDELNANYRLIHVFEGGDKDLGGEKLLKYLAFEIFKINTDKLFNDGNGNKIQFTLDYDSSDADCVNFKTLIDNESVYANRNMYNLMEKLRWAWEGAKTKEDEDTQEDYEKRSTIVVDLVNEKGEPKPGCELSNIKYSEEGEQIFVNLQDLLDKRIDKAVHDFFATMREAFNPKSEDKKSLNKQYDIKDFENIPDHEIAIFLAGNSTKSERFREILDDYISDNPKSKNSESQDLHNDYSMSEYSDDPSKDFVPPTTSTSKAKEILGLDKNCELHFKIYPPLGEKEAKEIQINRGYKKEDVDKSGEPTCKTGVAYGLLIEGIDIQDVNAKEDGQTGFDFYVGKDKRGIFDIVLFKNCSSKWEYFKKTQKKNKTYELFYTTSPNVTSGIEVKESKSKTKWLRVDNPVDGAEIEVRAISKDTIEWRVIRNNEEILPPQKITLEE